MRQVSWIVFVNILVDTELYLLDHMFFHKWAMLVDPKDILGGAKGYVKCDINVIGKGEQVKVEYKCRHHFIF